MPAKVPLKLIMSFNVECKLCKIRMIRIRYTYVLEEILTHTIVCNEENETYRRYQLEIAQGRTQDFVKRDKTYFK